MEKKERIVIGKIEGREHNEISGFSYTLLLLGFLLMVCAIVLETSAVRLAAWGAIWTGWNVLCGFGLANRRTIEYTVYRENQTPTA